MVARHSSQWQHSNLRYTLRRQNHHELKLKVVLASSDFKLYLNYLSPSDVGALTNPSVHIALNGENRVNLHGLQAAHAAEA